VLEPVPMMYVFAGNNGGHVVRQMQEAKQNGFLVAMFYVGLGDPKLNIERVAARVRNGGHHISSSDILKRHVTSIQNLLKHLELIDHLFVIDNSNLDGEMVLEVEGTIKYKKDPLPSWVRGIWLPLKITCKPVIS